MRMPLEAIIFDHDGVLADLNYRKAAAFFSQLLPLSLGGIVQEWNRWVQESQKHLRPGALRWDDFWDDLSVRLKLSPEVLRELKSFRYLDLFQAFPDARPALLEARHRGLRVAVLSNTPLVDLQEPLTHMGLDDLVDVICNPQATGATKPAPEAYQRVLEMLGLEASRCLFLDDEKANVSGAELLGMRAWHVERQRPAHDLERNVVRDLSALPDILARNG
ncbi:HAD family hydrolase [Archangium lipolyticum]|uniref:HAD family hydrolase n=1 Tax=Archangium lipolyticum TaxID=2970465 RepID=UPI002149BD00|nr:HAD-IA family hydrolase [Archangium lipolyticum]